MIYKHFLASLVLPFLAGSGFLQSSIVANSIDKPIVGNFESQLRTLQDHADIQQNQPRNFHPDFFLSARKAKVEPFRPACKKNDKLCAVWSEFRAPPIHIRLKELLLRLLLIRK